MENIPLGHLSRPQLVNLLLRIVDLLSQPVQPFPPAQATQACPVLEPYDASIDPWNAPEPTQPVNVFWSRGQLSGDHQWYCIPSRAPEPGSDGFLRNGALGHVVVTVLEGLVNPHLNQHLDSHDLAPSPRLTWLRLPRLARLWLIPTVRDV